ncbi:TonB-dependent receptor [Pelagicoccus enzymogenes]|uniref:TonB-dependent receptor n=1 Tax=Pelagicoccus enzymogenes TaxID=2773457 RepID=UPI00280D55AA|nr:TonB-dependent receptor plug domain-containing protein [Pelagicoccus enzymogenes]MDQ8201114.1 TonB-dependent receptor [Pelagicoccus enzymogenes]
MYPAPKRFLAYSFLLIFSAVWLRAHDAVYLPAFEVAGRESSLHGEASSASQGFVGADELQLSLGEGSGGLLEAVPGMVATQHSGSGKGNQYFLRGFNLDHGTDFAVSVDGMPVNIASHGHGQGYADLNFLIPEMVSMVSYLKGPYYSMVGDFSSAGSASLQLRDLVERDFAEVGIGDYGQQRFVSGVSRELAGGDSLFGLELENNDGPWDLDENLRKRNGLFRYSKGNYDQKFSLTFMGYDSSWTATDQIPEREVESGRLSDFGFVDPTVGGRTSRYSLSANWKRDRGHVRTFATAYGIHYDMNLWSNFTYFLDDEEDGDQFEQADRRQTYGLSLGKVFYYQELWGKQVNHTVILQGRWDEIDKLGLYKTRERSRLEAVREDAASVVSTALAYEATLDWTARLRSQVGMRWDRVDGEVDAIGGLASRKAGDDIVSPKANLIFTQNDAFEWYASFGEAFHSNDVRGMVDGADPLAGSQGSELGLRYQIPGKLNASLAVWDLDLDSELLYVGDAGTNEISGASERNGVDVAVYAALSENLSMDLDYTWSDARYRDAAAGEAFIPGVVEEKLGLGAVYRFGEDYDVSLRYRYFGGRPLDEAGSVFSESSETVSLQVAGRLSDWEWTAQLSNLFDSRDPDISYYYESRLPGEPSGGVADIHSHVMKPRRLQLTLRRLF